MDPVRIRDDVDPESPQYRRNLIIVIMIVLGLSIVGGAWLGYKIRGAENARDEAQEQPADDGDAPDEARPGEGAAD